MTTPGGWPAITAAPAFVSGESHGIREFLEGCEAAPDGRATFEPGLAFERVRELPGGSVEIAYDVSGEASPRARPRGRLVAGVAAPIASSA